MVEREIMIDEHPKIGRVSQSGAFFCYVFLFVVFYGFIFCILDLLPNNVTP